MTHNAENDAPEPECVECGMTGQCAGCYLMEQRGLTPPPHVIPPAVDRPVSSAPSDTGEDKQ